MDVKKIGIIGYGELGRAIHGLLRAREDLVIDAWDKKDKENKLNTIVSSVEVVFLCVPSWCVREALESIRKYISKKVLVVCLSKGIESVGLSTVAGKGRVLKTMDVVLKEVLGPNQHFAILGGPMLAEELASSKRGFAVFASKHNKDFHIISDIFHKTNLKVKYSRDLRGVALCGVLKNIYALGLGICDGLNLGSNAKGELTLEAVKEMIMITEYLGGGKRSALGEAGMGDLIATAFSNFSRNREVGETLAKSGICCLESEGYRSVNSVIDILGKKYLSFPFLAAIKLIVLDNKKSTDSFCDLLENQFYI